MNNYAEKLREIHTLVQGVYELLEMIESTSLLGPVLPEDDPLHLQSKVRKLELKLAEARSVSVILAEEKTRQDKKIFQLEEALLDFTDISLDHEESMGFKYCNLCDKHEDLIDDIYEKRSKK